MTKSRQLHLGLLSTALQLAEIGAYDPNVPTVLELCAGAGGQALGFERAGFRHVGLVEIDQHACATLRLNRPEWRVFETDLNHFDARAFQGVDVVAGGLPCPPFSVAGKQLGEDDERNLFPAAFRIIGQAKPRVVVIENVKGLLEARFTEYRATLDHAFRRLGYEPNWALLQASNFGVPQLRPRVALIAVHRELKADYRWPRIAREAPLTVGEALVDLMAAGGWQGATKWATEAATIAPTIVGGSKKHGGPDLGPTRARAQWAVLGVDGRTIANQPPTPHHQGMPSLTVQMVARLQGFPDDWHFAGGKTAAYRQVGNALPPPMSAGIARSIANMLRRAGTQSNAPAKRLSTPHPLSLIRS